jgi:hypothetical protein
MTRFRSHHAATGSFALAFARDVTLQRISTNLSYARKHKSCQGHLYIPHCDIKEHSCRDDAGDEHMVLQILANAGQVLDDVGSKTAKRLRFPDA